MTFNAYTNNIPFATHDPSADQPIMLQNTNSTSNIWLTDHHGFNDNLGGYHTIIHQDPQSDPTPIPGINQIYVKTVLGDTQLFSMTGGGGISQLTGGSASASGFQYLGNVLLQWGTGVTATLPSSTTITYPKAFTTSVFNVQATFISSIAGASGNRIWIEVFNVGLTTFEVATLSTANETGFYWLAIGV